MVKSRAGVFSEVTVMRMIGHRGEEVYTMKQSGAASAVNLNALRLGSLRSVNLSERRKKNRKSDAK